MEYTVSSTDDIDSVVPAEFGGMWFFRDALGCENLGLTLLELEPGGKGKRHDHAGTDHEEVYLVVDGAVTVEIGGTADEPERSELLERGEAIRLGAETERQLHNHGEKRVRIVAAGAP